MTDRSWTRWLALIGVAAVITAAGFAAGCGGDDDDDGDATPAATAAPTVDATAAAATAEVEAAVQGMFDAWNAKDVDALVASFTEEGLANFFGDEGQTAAEVQAGLPDFIGSDEITDAEFDSTEVDGETASTDVQFSVGGTADAATFLFVRDAGAWKIDGEEHLAVAVPDGVEAIPVDLNEFAFAVNTDDITATDSAIAFEANNVGAQAHELALARIPTEIPLETIVNTILTSEGEEPPPGVGFIGAVADIPPGETDNLILTGLGAGRYLMICLFPDTDDPAETPHAAKGMVKEFTIGVGPAAGVSPAATP